MPTIGPSHHHKPGTEAGRRRVLGIEVSLSVRLHHTCFLCRRSPAECLCVCRRGSLYLGVRILPAQPPRRGIFDSLPTRRQALPKKPGNARPNGGLFSRIRRERDRVSGRTPRFSRFISECTRGGLEHHLGNDLKLMSWLCGGVTERGLAFAQDPLPGPPSENSFPFRDIGMASNWRSGGSS
jgi:hypothetical protein